MVGGELFMRAVQRGRRDAAADRQRALGDLPVACPRTRATWDARRRQDHPHRLGRAVPHRASRARCADVTPERGLRASELGDGPQDLGRLGHHDEQGARGDRGALPVRPAARAARGGDPSAKRHPFDGPVPRRARWSRSWARPTCACRSPSAWPGRTASSRGAQAAGLHVAGRHDLRIVDSRGHRDAFPGLALAWDALRAAPGTTAVLNAANEVAVAAFLERRARASTRSTRSTLKLWRRFSPPSRNRWRTCWRWTPRSRAAAGRGASRRPDAI